MVHFYTNWFPVWGDERDYSVVVVENEAVTPIFYPDTQERMQMIEQLTSLYRGNETPCNEKIQALSYYQEITDFFKHKPSYSNEIPFDRIPLCWKGIYNRYGHTSWVLLDGFIFKEGKLYGEVWDHRQGPPLDITVPMETIPDNVLLFVLDLLLSEKGLNHGDGSSNSF